jgi:hypothetical protein
MKKQQRISVLNLMVNSPFHERHPLFLKFIPYS